MDSSSAFSMYKNKQKSQQPKQQNTKISKRAKKKSWQKSKNRVITSLSASASGRTTPVIHTQHAPLEKKCDQKPKADFVPIDTDSEIIGYKVFKWVVAPCLIEDFLKNYWEKKPIHIVRKKSDFYTSFISTPMIDEILRKDNVRYSENIDITSYSNGVRETHNPDGRALPHTVWDFYSNGCSIRLLNPQTFIPRLHLLLASLQEYTGSFVGLNAYLTPPDTQGFAPHYDDIEAFILQIEGKKMWRIYSPRSQNEFLPRTSSENFKQEEIGKPIFEVMLEAGDMLYFPRGYIHQATALPGEHSLHLTLSMYQKRSWADLFEKMLPSALQCAIHENIMFREGLPVDIHRYFGVTKIDTSAQPRTQWKIMTKVLFEKLFNYLDIDSSVDQLCKEFQAAALPPVLSEDEKSVTVYSDTTVMLPNAKLSRRVQLNLTTKVRLLRKNIMRVIIEEGNLRVSYHAGNSLVYHGHEPTFLDVDDRLKKALTILVEAYPKYVVIKSLPAPDNDMKINLCASLWECGILMTDFPLPIITA